jgi:hypothetical protein
VIRRAAARLTYSVLALCAMTAPRGVAAQGPRGAGPDARPIPAGTLRISAGATWDRSPEEYVGSGPGSLRGRGWRFTADSLTPTALPVLGPVQSLARTASGIPSLGASLGALTSGVRTTRETTPFEVEAGLTSRLSLSVRVPLVTMTSRVSVRMNPLGREATVGINPAYLTTEGTNGNTLLAAQLDTAARALNARIATCATQPAATGCAAFNANAATARATVTEATAFRAAMVALYGAGTSPGMPFVPTAGSAAQAAIDARIAGFKATFAALGISSLTAAGPGGAAPLTAGRLQSVLQDSAYGIRSTGLVPTVYRGTGDIEVTGRYTWHDSYANATRAGSWRQRLWWRAAVAATVRVGGTGRDASADLVALPLGAGSGGYAIAPVTDVGIGTKASVTVSLRAASSAAQTLRLRIPTTRDAPFPSADRVASVTRTPGSLAAVGIYPRWTLTDAVAIAGYYGYESEGADRYTGSASVASPSGGTQTATASVLDGLSERREHRAGAFVTYSAAGSSGRRAAGWPAEVSLGHFQTTAATGGRVLKHAYDEVTVRWYWRPLGR